MHGSFFLYRREEGTECRFPFSYIVEGKGTECRVPFLLDRRWDGDARFYRQFVGTVMLLMTNYWNKWLFSCFPFLLRCKFVHQTHCVFHCVETNMRRSVARKSAVRFTRFIISASSWYLLFCLSLEYDQVPFFLKNCQTSLFPRFFPLPFFPLLSYCYVNFHFFFLDVLWSSLTATTGRFAPPFYL